MSVVLSVLYILLWLFIGLLWIRFVISWVMVFAPRWTPGGPVLIGVETVYTATDPPIRALRKVVPTLQLGQFRIDLSFLLVMVIAWLLLSVVGTLMSSA